MRLREQLELVKRYYEELKRRLESSQFDIYAVERLAELVAQSLIDLAAMYLKGREKPPTYRALLEQFGREIGFDPKKLGAVAALRNVLIHRYFAVSVEKELEAFRNLVEMMPQVISLAESAVGDDPCVEDAKRLGEVFKKHGVVYAYLFGSTARKGCGRDLDIAVKFAESKNLMDVAMLIRDAEEALGLPDGLVDVVDLDDAPPHIVLSILENFVVIYGDEEEAIRYLTARWTEAQDLLVTYRKSI